MIGGPFQPIRPAVIEWQEQATPFSAEYRDAYFSRIDGPAESAQVFVAGNRLEQRFARLASGEHFVIGETGFGTGLNCMLAAREFRSRAPAGARLTLISAEKHPLDPIDLRRALEQWPALAPHAGPLLDGWPPPVPGFHRVRLAPEIELIVMFGDAAEMWSRAPVRVDAWFLDGFAPDRNPEMWRPALFRAVADRSRPGATLGTYTAAGAVRRGLAAAGFEVARQPGFGPKRHRLTGSLPGRWAPARLRTGRVLVAGAGLAGATTARALADLGWRVRVLDPTGIASGASGNRAGVVYTTPSAHSTAQNRFYQASYLAALAWMRRLGFPAGPEQGRLSGVIQHFVDPRHRDRIESALASGLWPPGLLAPAGGDAVELPGGGYIDPRDWCRLLLDHSAIELGPERVAGLLAGAEPGFELDGRRCMSADAAVVCSAGHARDLAGLEWLPVKPIRGQVSHCPPTAASRRWFQAECHAGYLTPVIGGLHCIGATFDLHQSDPGPFDIDDRTNLEQLRTHLPERWRALGGPDIRIVERRAGLRCQSSDFVPLCGAVPDTTANPHSELPGVYLNFAHGSRGITGTPLCAELLAGRISGLPTPVDRDLVAALDPARFILRRRRRDPDWRP